MDGGTNESVRWLNTTAGCDILRDIEFDTVRGKKYTPSLTEEITLGTVLEILAGLLTFRGWRWRECKVAEL